MPEITETIDEKALNLVPREGYMRHIKKYPNLPKMHRSMMADLKEPEEPE
jgi:hypothetical protein